MGILTFVGIYLITLVISVATAIAFTWACVAVLGLLLEAYDRFKASKFYKKCMLMRKIWTGEIEVGVIEIKPNGNMTYHPNGKISQSDTPDEINRQLENAKSKGSVIEGEGAGKWEPDEQTKQEIIRRSK